MTRRMTDKPPRIHQTLWAPKLPSGEVLGLTVEATERESWEVSRPYLSEVLGLAEKEQKWKASGWAWMREAKRNGYAVVRVKVVEA